MPRWIYIALVVGVFAGCDSSATPFRGGAEGTGTYSGPAVELQNIAWKYRSPAEVQGPPAFAHDSIYVANVDGLVAALEPDHGEERWKVELDHGVHAPLVASRNRIVVGTDGGLRALSHDGELLWSFDTEAPIDAAPLLWDAVLYVGSRDGTFYAVDAVGGALIFKATTAGPIATEAVRVADQIAVGGGDGRVYLIDRATGEPAWTWAANAPIRGIAAGSGLIYVSAGTRVVALATEKPEVRWQFDVGAPVETPPTVWKGNVLVGSAAGQVVALDATDGSQGWRAELGAPPRGAMTASGNRLYVPTTRKGIHAISPSGESVWTFRTDGAVVSGPIPEQGRLYFADRAGSVYAIE